MAEEVDVVVGAIVEGHRFLVERRGPDEILDPGVVCLPGGHVDEGESYEKALKREMFEELGITVKSIRFIGEKFRVASNGECQHSYCFHITTYEGRPMAKSAKEIFWTSNLNDLSLEVDKELVKELIRSQKHSAKC